MDLLLLGPAVRWLRTGRATLAAWSRIYIDLRFLLIVIGWTGVVALQDNSAFAVAAALTLAGLRMQPLKKVSERDPRMGSCDAAKALAEGQRAARSAIPIWGCAKPQANPQNSPARRDRTGLDAAKPIRRISQLGQSALGE